MSKTHDVTNGPGGTTLWHGANKLVVSRSQTVGSPTGGVVGFDVVLGVGGVVGITQGVCGTCHSPAVSEQLPTWPFGERHSLLWELSQVPHCPSVFPSKRE